MCSSQSPNSALLTRSTPRPSSPLRRVPAPGETNRRLASSRSRNAPPPVVHLLLDLPLSPPRNVQPVRSLPLKRGLLSSFFLSPLVTGARPRRQTRPP